MRTALLLGLLLVAMAACAQPPRDVPTAQPVAQPVNTAGNALPPDTTGETKTFVLTGENFAFFMDGEQNPELRVNVGDTVRIEFTSSQGFHDFIIDEFGAKTERVQSPASTSVEFVAYKAGTFEYYCSVGQHRANGMWGNLVVE